MVKALEGNENSYRQLLTALKPWLTAYFSTRAHLDQLDELVQDTLLSVHSKRHTFDPKQPFGYWVAAVARHRLIDHLRKSQRYTETDLDDAMLELAHEQDHSAEHDINALLGTIPKAQAEAIALVRLQELSMQEASERTGHSVSAIKVMVHRGIKKMQHHVQEFNQHARPTC